MWKKLVRDLIKQYTNSGTRGAAAGLRGGRLPRDWDSGAAELYAMLYARMPRPVTESGLSKEFSDKELRVLMKHNGIEYRIRKNNPCEAFTTESSLIGTTLH